ncbi:unnamed protein product [Amoebophrya sp. A25]|nr:unnamed protein product [Amoebophrya sp. A25]|eukprot:GSA25T00025594001.1
MSGEIRFDGFEGELLDLNGAYVRAPGVNHGKPTFKKIDSGNQSVMIYYWDERDGVQLRGWWVAPEVGGSNVWAMSTATSNMPPHSGWRVPWHGDVNKKVTLSKVMGGGDPSKRPATDPWGTQQANNKFAKTATGAAVPGAPGANNPNNTPLGQTQQWNSGQQQQQPAGQYGAWNAPGGYGGGQQAGGFQATAYGNKGGAKPGAAGTGSLAEIEQQRRDNELKRLEQEEKRKQVMEQTRQERKLSESVNGSVLAASNAERSFIRVKDSQAAAQLFAMEVVKPQDLARFSAEVEKGLKAAQCSLNSAQTLHSRKMEELEQSQLLNSKTVESLRQQLTEAKGKLDAATLETREFSERVSNRQKELWSKLVGDIVEKSQKDMSEADAAVEALKDQSALLSSEIAEHLSPAEAIDAADTSHEAAVAAESKIVEGRDNMHRRRTEVMTAINFFRQSAQVMGTADSPAAEDPLNLAGKKKAVEEFLQKFPLLLTEVTKIRNLAVHIGNRARQAEALRKKQEQKEALKRKNERRAKWNKQLIQDLGCEVTLCVDSLHRTEELKQKLKALTEEQKDETAIADDQAAAKEQVGKEIEKEFESLKLHLEQAKRTFEDFVAKKDMITQTGQEIERWGQRIEELEAILKREIGTGIKKADVVAEVPGSLMVAGLLIKYLEDEQKNGDQLWKEIISIKGGGSGDLANKASWYKFLEWTKRHGEYFGEKDLDKHLHVDLPPPTSTGINEKSRLAVLQSHLKDAFEELDLPLGPAGTAKRSGFVEEQAFSTVYRKFFVYDRQQLCPLVEQKITVKAGASNPPGVRKDGLIEELCITPELEDEDDSSKFPVLEDRTVIEMFGPLSYASGDEKSRVRMKVKLIDGNGIEQIGFITYWAHGRAQVQELTTMQCVSETVMTTGAELKNIKTVRRAKREEFFRILDISPVNTRPMIRIFVQALSDQKRGYVTVSNATNYYMKPMAVPRPQSETEAAKAVPAIGAVRVSMYEAVSVLHDKEWRSAFLVERGKVPNKVNIAWESDETLSEVDIDTVRASYDQKKKITLSIVTKETLQKLAKEHFLSILKQVSVPEVPPEGISEEEMHAACIEAMEKSYRAQKLLDLCKSYLAKREIRFLLLGDPSVFKEPIEEFNVQQEKCNNVRLSSRRAKESVEKILMEMKEAEIKQQIEEENRRHEEEEQALMSEAERLMAAARVFAKSLEEKLNAAEESAPGTTVPTEDPADVKDWDAIIGDIKHALGEAQQKATDCEAYLNKIRAANPRLTSKIQPLLADIANMMTFDGIPALDRVESTKKKAVAFVFEKYQQGIFDYLQTCGQTADTLFDQLIADQQPADSSEDDPMDGSKPVLRPETLKKKFPTSFDLCAMSKEQFELFCGCYYLLRKDAIVITTAASIREGKLLTKLPQWTIVQMLGDAVVDPDTENVRRKGKVFTLPYREDPNAENTAEGTPAVSSASEAADGEKLPTVSGEGYEGYLTVFDRNTLEANLNAYGISGLTSPVTVVKDTVLTDLPSFSTSGGDGASKFKVIRRVRAGESMELMGLPQLQPPHMLRAPVRAVSDGKEGWLTLYDHSWKNSFVEL